MPVAKEQIRQIISENNLNSVTDVYKLLRDNFKDILQELMEAEPDAPSVMRKTARGICRQTTNVMGIPQKIARVSMGNYGLTCPGTGMGSLSQS